MPVAGNNHFPQISYQVHGTGQPVILIHGFPADGTLWREVVPVLSASFRVIVPDLPGAGNSAFAGEDLAIEQLAESIKLVMDNENVAQAVIAGHSLGGYTVLALAEKYPNAIKGLSLVHSTAAADTMAKKEMRQKAIDIMRSGGKDAFVRQAVINLFSSGFRKGRGDVVETQVQGGIRLPAENLIGFYNAMMNRPDRFSVIKDNAHPVQWLAGKEDQVIPPQDILKQVYLNDINFVTFYENCGHMGMLEVPQNLAHDLKEFITYCYSRS